MPRPVMDDDRAIMLRGLDGVSDLAVVVTVDPSGHKCIISCWMLNDADIREILHTRRVWVVTLGTRQPPIKLVAEKPYAPRVPRLHDKPCEYLDSQREVWDE